MSQPDDRATLAAAERLEAAMGGLREDIGGLRTYGERNRHYIWGLAISLILDVVLSVAVAVIAVQAGAATSAASQNRQTQIVTCKAGNDSRAANRNLWAYILDVTEQANPNAPAKQREQLAGLREFVEQIFAPRDCNDLTAPRTIPISPPR